MTEPREDQSFVLGVEPLDMAWVNDTARLLGNEAAQCTAALEKFASDLRNAAAALLDGLNQRLQLLPKGLEELANLASPPPRDEN